MSMLLAWVPRDADADVTGVLNAMSAALIVHPGQQQLLTAIHGAGVGVIEPPPIDGHADDLRPAVSDDGRHTLWMAGEAFVDDQNGRTLRFRRGLLQAWLDRGPEAVSDLDGEYQIAVWDRGSRTLTVVNDRFGGLPLYVGESREGVAVAGGVRGVLMAPGMNASPDPDALREAMTFGGYCLGDRTNVAGVKMVPGASIVSITGSRVQQRRYWTWNDIPPPAVRDVREAVEHLAPLWRAAIGRRMRGPGRFGQTLSGGLDSRAILAEVPPRSWTAITYGVPGCDDARYAERAAQAVGARWIFHELYSGANPDWLDRRGAFIGQTDGLMQLGDLMHLEALDLQRASFDVHLSGYVGDAVSGPTFGNVTTAAAALVACPYYETSLGLGWVAALARIETAMSSLGGAAARFVLFEHKLPQATNRWPTAWRPWLRVRKPFLDYAFFDFCQGLPSEIRVAGRLHERWLRSTYPACFAAIPNHKTGAPAFAPAWRVQLARAWRVGGRTLLPMLPRPWRPAPRIRAYHDDDRVWRQPAFVGRIVETITAPGSLCCEILGREAVTRLLGEWRASARAPAQVIGALYVYEQYHRELPAGLARTARLASRPGRVGLVTQEEP